MSALVQSFDTAATYFRNRARVLEYREDFDLWCRERAGLHLWSKQREIGESIRANKKTAVKSCHDSGKSFSAAYLICWWIDVYADEDAFVITTAPTSNQVNNILWEYVRKIHRDLGLRGRVSEAAEWKDDNRDVIGLGRKPADGNDHGFQGHHHKYTLVVIDEACGITQSLFTAVEAVTTNDTSRILAIGNPDDPATEFGRIFKEDPTWNKITISAFDTPNFTGEDVSQEAKDNLLSVQWVEEKRLSWGEGSNRWLAKVLAQFPQTATDSFFSPALIEKTQDVVIIPSEAAKPQLGLDVARFGNDLTVLACYLDGDVSIIDAWDDTDLVTSAKKAHSWAVKLGADSIRVDATGIGAGVVDNLVQERGTIYSYTIHQMYGSAASPDPDRWLNARAYWHDHLRTEMVKNRIHLPSNTSEYGKKLKEELEGILYKFNKRGALQIESKDDMRKRGIKSPDFSDAVVYACADVADPDDFLANALPGTMVTASAHDLVEDYDIRGFVISPF